MEIKRQLAAFVAAVGLSIVSNQVMADDHAYTDGPVVNVASIRTADGKFDDYMKWLDTVWKAEQEAGKKSGDVLSYRVLTVEPRSENDPDVLLVVNYKNWAALDNSTAKADAISKQIEGSLEKAAQGAADRGKIRRVLGSFTAQEALLK
jgi:hypothetical protein